MKKCICLSLLSLFLISCNESPIESIEEVESIEILSETEDIDTGYQLLEDFLLFKSNLTSYEISEVGSTKANKGIINYEQKVNSSIIKDNNLCYLYTDTSSLFVNKTHTAYYENDNVKYKNKNDREFIDSSLDDYLNVYGTYPLDNSLMGFDIKKEHIISSKLVYTSTKQYLTIVFNGNQAGEKVKIQTKEYGDLNSYPVFESTSFILELDYLLSPISITLDTSYEIDINVLGKIMCKQHLVQTYSKINEKVNIPNID